MTQPAESLPLILIVDDEPLLRISAAVDLEEAGFQTVEAESADDALRALDGHPEISVLFTDINMPGGLSGLELARVVHERRPDIQLILTSGRERPADADIPDDGKFVAKPYSTATVEALIRAGGKRAH